MTAIADLVEQDAYDKTLRVVVQAAAADGSIDTAEEPTTMHLEQFNRVPPVSGGHTFTAADVGSQVNADGTWYKGDQKHTDGHSKVVALEQLTGDGYLGFATRVSDVQNPMDGEFVYLRGPNGAGGGFERYQDAAPTGWYPGHTPFDAGEIWENAPVATGIDYVGALTYRGHVSTQADAERNANAAGEVFVVLDAEIILFVDEYTAPGADETVYYGVPTVPGYFNNPSLVLWGLNQTKRIDTYLESNHGPIVAVQQGTIHLKWKLDDDELFHGALASMVEILAAADAPINGDSMPPVANRAGIYLKFRAGVWSFEGNINLDEITSYAESLMLRVVTLADQVISGGSSFGFGEATSGLGTPVVGHQVPFLAPLIKVAEDDVFYVAHSRLSGTRLTSQYLRATYHGP